MDNHHTLPPNGTAEAMPGDQKRRRGRWEQMLQELNGSSTDSAKGSSKDLANGNSKDLARGNSKDSARGNSKDSAKAQHETRCQTLELGLKKPQEKIQVVNCAERKTRSSPAPRRSDGGAVKIAMLVWGSRGDFQPCVALAVRLQDCGYEVLLFCNDDDGQGRPGGHAAFARSLGLEVRVYPGDVNGDKGERQCFVFDQVREYRPAILLYWWLLALEAWTIEDVLGIPAVDYCLGVFPSREFIYNYLTWHRMLATARLGMHIGKPPLDDIISQDDVAARLWGPDQGKYQTWDKNKDKNKDKDYLSLYAYSQHCLERPPEWPPGSQKDGVGVHLTGYWLFDQDMQRQLLEDQSEFLGASKYRELEMFLDAGEPPVYIGWGSTGGHAFDNVTLGRLAVRALRLAGRRGIILGSYRGIDASSLEGADDSADLLSYAQDKVFWAKWAPHEWLFPRCRVLVIHGGTNTTASALRSGRPTLVTPIAHDQFDWADRVVSLGVGLRTGQLGSVTAEELGKKICRCGFPKFKKPCRELAAKLQAEDGVGNAVELLNVYVARLLQKQAGIQKSLHGV